MTAFISKERVYVYHKELLKLALAGVNVDRRKVEETSRMGGLGEVCEIKGDDDESAGMGQTSTDQETDGCVDSARQYRVCGESNRRPGQESLKSLGKNDGNRVQSHASLGLPFFAGTFATDGSLEPGWIPPDEGSSWGIGRDTAIIFAKAGTSLILSARRADQLAKTKELCLQANQNVKVHTIELDVSKAEQVQGVLQKIPQDLKEVDCLVNNAGLVKGREVVGDVSNEDIDTMMNTNVLGLIGMTQIFVREFKKRDKGHIIMLGSVAGREGYAGGSIYNATKFAVRGFTSALLNELVNTQVRVSEVQPGLVETEFSLVRFRGDKSAADNVYAGLQPLIGLDIAEEIFWIASRPPHINIAELFVMPVNQASATLKYQKPSS
ncbi:MAG: hypothetical protein CYPHOPRED_005361 [Cyphobasidiales sp. Tagirdzhanova-0007]|nr:MAG: hypothetical protein CYPHOPRED_005361 [Cyphobasidiales sp. Tagirdzhanova-0007]